MTHRYFLLFFAAALLTIACDDNHDRVLYDDVVAPLPPVGIISISLDNAVELVWIENQERDLDGYNIYVSDRYDGRYSYIGNSRSSRFIDYGAVNGRTYYYAVSAYDFTGNESELSKDVVYDTPRPEGRDVQLLDRFIAPDRAGYDFSRFRSVHYDTDETDFFFEISDSGVPWLVVWDDSDIQDMGFTKNLDEISRAPIEGWNPTGDALAVRGHTYVIKTFDNHFAKLRIIDVTPNAVVFDWAYQIDRGNPELIVARDSSMKKRVRAGSRHSGSTR
ncbi:MAG: hypothetical protein M5R41_17510 [Bacteroidia bacterium]|nr:hypothetical protein [Bacteroidia bacterium]